MEERLVRDVYPAEVLLPDGKFIKGIRVFITTHRIYGYDAQGQTVVEVINFPLSDIDQIPRSRSTLIGNLQLSTEVGNFYVNKGQGCGCGSILKALPSPINW